MGSAGDLKERFAAHERGDVASTKAFRP
ncbi:MAG: hypothetical protein ABIQ30_17440 [Devosia sp.]